MNSENNKGTVKNILSATAIAGITLLVSYGVNSMYLTNAILCIAVGVISYHWLSKE